MTNIICFLSSLKPQLNTFCIKHTKPKQVAINKDLDLDLRSRSRGHFHNVKILNSLLLIS